MAPRAYYLLEFMIAIFELSHQMSTGCTLQRPQYLAAFDDHIFTIYARELSLKGEFGDSPKSDPCSALVQLYSF